MSLFDLFNLFNSEEISKPNAALMQELYRNPACHHMPDSRIEEIARNIERGGHEAYIYINDYDRVK